MFGYVQTLAVDPLMVSASIDPRSAGFRAVLNVSLEGNTEVSYLRTWSIFLDLNPGCGKDQGLFYSVDTDAHCSFYRLYIERVCGANRKWSVMCLLVH